MFVEQHLEAIATQQLEDFFMNYAARFNQALGENPTVDLQATASAFANCFIEASPRGVHCGRNDDEFRAAITKGSDFYRSIGTKSMRIIEMFLTPLDDYHWMVKVHWDSHYQKQDGSEEQIEFAVVYLLQTVSGEPKIFAYITGDEQKVLQRKGLIPE